MWNTRREKSYICRSRSCRRTDATSWRWVTPVHRRLLQPKSSWVITDGLLQAVSLCCTTASLRHIHVRLLLLAYLLSQHFSLSLPPSLHFSPLVHFNDHFCTWWTWISRYQNVSILDFIGTKDDGGGGDGYKTCKAPLIFSPPTFYMSGSLHVALKGNSFMFHVLLTPPSPALLMLMILQ